MPKAEKQPSAWRATQRNPAELRHMKYGGDHAPTARFYADSIESNDWSRAALIRGWRINLVQFEEFEHAAHYEFQKNGLWKLRWEHPFVTALQLEDMIRSLKSEFTWLSDKEIPQTWLFLSIVGYLRRLAVEIRGDTYLQSGRRLIRPGLADPKGIPNKASPEYFAVDHDMGGPSNPQ